MAIERIVNSKFTANDKITKRFSIMEKAAARFGRGADKAFRRASRSASRFKGITGGILRAASITRGLGLIESGLSRVTSGFIEFEKAARGATVRFKDIGPDAENFNQQMKLIRKSARDAGATTEFTAAQAAKALDFLARAGFKSTEAMGSLRSMINLSTATGEDFASVADMSSDLLGAFGLNADNTADKIRNLNRVNDVLVKTANSANVTVETMFETFKDAAPIGRKLGIELEEIAAFTAIMGNAGIKGTKAGTALKNSFLNLSTQAPKVVKMLDSIGVRIDDGQGNMRNFSDILEDVGKNIKSLGTLDQAKVLNTLFGKRAIAGASNLIDSISEIKQFIKTLKDAGGTSKKTADILRQGLEARLQALRSASEELGFKILEAFEKRGAKGVNSLTESIRKFDPKPIIEFFEFVASGIKFIFEWRTAIFAVVGIFLALKTALSIATVAMGIFNIVAALNPISLIVIGVAAAIVAFAALVIWIDDVAKLLNKLPFILKVIMGPMILMVNAIKFIIDNIGTVARFLGFGSDETPEAGVAGVDGEDGRLQRIAPNQREADARATQSTFRGRLDISGAPKGSTITTESSSGGDFDFALMGA
ncbi:MAG: phage tail tape measure protein [Nitrospinaceae bacterium]